VVSSSDILILLLLFLLLRSRIRYLIQSDPKGWVPASALKAISSQMPGCVATVRDYLTTHGPPAIPWKMAGICQSMTFSHLTSELRFSFKSTPSEWIPSTQIFVSPKRYPQGVDITVSPADGLEISWDEDKAHPF